MKKLTFLIFILCFFTILTVAQKTVRKRPKLQPAQTSNEQLNDIRILSEEYEKKSIKFDLPVKILEKPRPMLFPDGQDCSQGKVVLRVTFLTSGKIGSISVISGLGSGKTEAAIEAAKKIKFEPAIKDQKRVSVTKTVDYSFTIY